MKLTLNPYELSAVYMSEVTIVYMQGIAIAVAVGFTMKRS